MAHPATTDRQFLLVPFLLRIVVPAALRQVSLEEQDS
jgi:hypothetical protein